ncbi:MAG TPA: hypothetical protein PK307_08715 [Spirochaetota bacterium]|nr:hypothetical protein [Spirochaetota bacterium]HOD16359.1 hypothetical protein [Spirochaetota bacterium]HPN10856.1 hypothetical protein [Spirochaetota bacterium]HQL82268.1 hypothetical protein [Spirochaetota bacterium]
MVYVSHDKVMKDHSHMRVRFSGDADDPVSSRKYWLSLPAGERIEAVEFLREQLYSISSNEKLPRIRREIILRDIQ